jgi:aryl-alcohol dehydrogenase-like predicted oxidoreductase
MEKRRIGSLEVSVVGLGTNNFGRRIDYEASARVVDAGLDAGINFFDTADVYGNGQSEEFIARALGSRRPQVVIATKFGSHMEGQGRGGSAEYIRKAIEASLRRLRTDCIDLYQIHSPDPHVPIVETLGALDELVKAGKVREIGCSNFSAEQLSAAAAAVRPGGARFVSVQNEYSLLKRDPEQGVLEMCERLGLAFIPYFPLASGLLTGKYRQGQPVPAGTRLAGGARPAVLNEHNLAIVESLIAFAEARGHTILELAFSWLLSNPVIASVIAGASNPDQVRANAAAANWNLTSDDLVAIDRLLFQEA